MKNEKVEILQTAYEYIDKLKNGVDTAAKKIEEGKEYDGVTIIPSIADGIGWLIKCIELTLDIQKEAVDIESLNEKLQEMIEALENEDYILLGDLLRYEIIPILDEFAEKIKESL